MKYRVNYMTQIKFNMRSLSLIIDANDPEQATKRATELLEAERGKDNYRITTVKPW